MKVQSTKVISALQLENGYEADFDTSQQVLKGFAIIRKDPNNTVLYGASVLGLKIDTLEIFPSITPLSLFQSSTSVKPNDRFFMFKKPFDITKKRFKVSLHQDTGSPVGYILMFLLDTNTDA